MEERDPAVSPATAVANELEAEFSPCVGAAEGTAVVAIRVRVVLLLVLVPVLPTVVDVWDALLIPPTKAEQVCAKNCRDDGRALRRYPCPARMPT